MNIEPIRAVIGVGFRKAFYDVYETFYVRRSKHMENYPGALSLPSIQFTPTELPDPQDLQAVQRIFDRMTAERFGNTPLKVHKFLVYGSSDQNPMQRMVELSLYQFRFDREPILNPQYYSESMWLSKCEFESRTVFDPAPCGLCTKLWKVHQAELDLL